MKLAAVAAALFFAGTSLDAADTTIRIVVLKKKHEMTLYRDAKALKTYKVALGNPAGRKERQGDRKTPEGVYTIVGRNAKSQFHRSLRISYPSAEDRKRAAKLGVSPGGDIMIHGLPNGYRAVGAAHRLKDWTDGCVAVTDEEIEEVWKLAPDGTTVEIKP